MGGGGQVREREVENKTESNRSGKHAGLHEKYGKGLKRQKTRRKLKKKSVCRCWCDSVRDASTGKKSSREEGKIKHEGDTERDESV